MENSRGAVSCFTLAKEKNVEDKRIVRGFNGKEGREEGKMIWVN